MAEKEIQEVDSWYILAQNINKALLTLIGSNPITWMRGFGIFCAAVLALYVILIILQTVYYGIFDNNLFALVPLAFGVIAGLSSCVGFVFYFLRQTKLKAASPLDATKIAKNYFALMWIFGLIQAPFIMMLTGLGHLDCNMSCVPSVQAGDYGAGIFYITFVALPFYLWIQAKRTLKVTEEIPKEPQVAGNDM
jgi:hypothetical protein